MICVNLSCDTFEKHHHGAKCKKLCQHCEGERYPEFRIRKLPVLKSAPWTVLSKRQLPMVGCLGYWYDGGEGEWAYPFKTQAFAIFALEYALKREALS